MKKIYILIPLLGIHLSSYAQSDSNYYKEEFLNKLNQATKTGKIEKPVSKINATKLTRTSDKKLTTSVKFEEISTVFKNFYYSSSSVGDLDGDGKTDVIFNGAIDSNGDNGVDLTYNEIYKNTGNNFEILTNLGDLHSTHSGDIKFIDFDNDGLLDIVSTGLSYNDISNYQQYRFKNIGNGFEMINNQSGKIFGGLDVFDFNHDGLQDYAINGIEYIQNTGFVFDLDLYLNTNGKTFEKNQAWMKGSQNGSFKLVDLNNDGELDLAMFGINSDYKPFFHIYHNINGEMTLAQELDGLSDGKMAYADFNGDGFLDLVITSQTSTLAPYLAVYMNNGEGKFTINQFENDGLKGSSVDVGDFNNDGYYDFVIIGNDNSYNGFTKVFTYNPESQDFELATETNLHNLGSNGGISVLDYDNDNSLDLIIHGFDWETSKNLPFTKLYRNISTTTNEKPSAPTELNTEETEDRILFTWNGATDDKTSTKSLQYEISVGTATGKSDLAKYIVTTDHWYLTKENLPENFFWSIKTIDASKTYSDSSEEQEFGSLNIESTTKNKVSVYPNPADKFLQIDSEQEIKNIKIYNFSGSAFSMRKLNKNKFDVSKLSSGVYVIEIELIDGSKINQKIIKK